MDDYHDLYLKSDVLLLADVLEKFISMRLEYYGLEPCHYLLKKEGEEVFLTLLKDTVKSIINTWNHMITIN